MPAPYIKTRNCCAARSVIDDAWAIKDGFGQLIAVLDTESMTDALLAYLLRDQSFSPTEYPCDVPLGESELIEVVEDDDDDWAEMQKEAEREE